MEALEEQVYQSIIVSDGSVLICKPPAREALRDALKALDITVEAELYNRIENNYLFLVQKQDTDKLPAAREAALLSLQMVTEKATRQIKNAIAVATNMDTADVAFFKREASRMRIQYSIESNLSNTYTIYVNNEVSSPGRTSSLDKARIALAKAAISFAGTSGRFVKDDLIIKDKQERVILQQLDDGVTNPFFVRSADRTLAFNNEGCQVICNNQRIGFYDAVDPNYKTQVMGLVQDMPAYTVLTKNETIARNALGTMMMPPEVRLQMEKERLLRMSVEAKLSMDNSRQSRFSSNIYDGHLSFEEFFKIECLNDHFEDKVREIYQMTLAEANTQNEKWLSDALQEADSYIKDHRNSELVPTLTQQMTQSQQPEQGGDRNGE